MSSNSQSSTTLDAFPSRLRRARERRGWSLGQLAAASGLTKEGIRQLELPTADPKVSTIYKIASALKVPVAELLGIPTASSSEVDDEEGVQDRVWLIARNSYLAEQVRELRRKLHRTARRRRRFGVRQFRLEEKVDALTQSLARSGWDRKEKSLAVARLKELQQQLGNITDEINDVESWLTLDYLRIWETITLIYKNTGTEEGWEEFRKEPDAFIRKYTKKRESDRRAARQQKMQRSSSLVDAQRSK